MTKNKVISIQIELCFGVMAACVHRVDGTKIYHNITQASWCRAMDTAKIAKSSREITKGREYQFYYI